MHKKLLTGTAVTTLLLGLAACDQDSEPGDEATAGQEAGAEGQEAPLGEEGMEMPEPDTEDIPEVVATVNGEDITGEEFIPLYEQQFQQMAMQSQMSGEQPDEEAIREQSLDSLVSTELLRQDAQGYEASEEEIEELLEDTAEQGGLESVDELVQTYEEQGDTEEDLREDAADQVRIDKVVDGLEVPEPTEEELQEAYEEMEAQQEMMAEAQGGEEQGGEAAEELPPFEEVRDQLEEQVIQEDQNQVVMEHVDQLREAADVETHL